MSEFRTSVLLSLQRALLGMVTPDLRSVEVALDGGRVAQFLERLGLVAQQQRHLALRVAEEAAQVADGGHVVVGDLAQAVLVGQQDARARVGDQERRGRGDGPLRAGGGRGWAAEERAAGGWGGEGGPARAEGVKRDRKDRLAVGLLVQRAAAV